MKNVIDKAESRGRALYDWLDSHHTFSFDTYTTAPYELRCPARTER